MKQRLPVQETFCEFTFDAAHKTTPETPLHGHTFRVRVAVTGERKPVVGWTHDLKEIEAAVATVRGQLDHVYLNEIDGLQTPTLENVAAWLWNRFDTAIHGLTRIEVSRGAHGSSEGVMLTG